VTAEAPTEAPAKPARKPRTTKPKAATTTATEEPTDAPAKPARKPRTTKPKATSTEES
jgi:hypothetical protein